MEILQVKNLSFTYPNTDSPAADDINMSVNQGEFILICGASGCGKTTLLRLIKKELAPAGNLKGEILYNLDAKGFKETASAFDVGFVFQNPDSQIVTDSVWHELSFGLENMGVPSDTIRRRVGEMASYFGINEWYHAKTDSLSGGQKQILNLASVMVMDPKILILDEPTSQLDPITASEFIKTVFSLNREFGITVIIAEHRLEELFPLADRVAVMDGGNLIFYGSPEKACGTLKDNPIFEGFPSAVKIFEGTKNLTKLPEGYQCPLTVRDCKNYLNANFSHLSGKEVKVISPEPTNPVIEAENLYFRYDKNLPDILRSMSISVCENEIMGILGGNGAGKTTALNVISGAEMPYRGHVKIYGKKIKDYKNNSLYRNMLAYLPQDPQCIFVKNKVSEDFEAALAALNGKNQNIASESERVSEELGISHLQNKHPYDLSGGELQKCALAKLMLTDPKIMLLDEPTKGLDAVSKNKLISLLRRLRAKGMTFLIVTHDIEFAAGICDRCAMFFDGGIISQSAPNEFFSSNRFYTTSAHRACRDIFPNAVLTDEVIGLCRGNGSVIPDN